MNNIILNLFLNVKLKKKIDWNLDLETVIDITFLMKKY